MKLKFDITIDAGMETVWAAFDDPDNMTRWMQNLESFTHQSGEPGQPGAVSLLVYDENGRKVEMKETLTERREPDFIAGVYETDWGKTLIVNNFTAVDENTTRWESWCNFSFKGFMKIMAIFLTGSIAKRTEGDMNRFKLLVESDAASNA